MKDDNKFEVCPKCGYRHEQGDSRFLTYIDEWSGPLVTLAAKLTDSPVWTKQTGGGLAIYRSEGRGSLDAFWKKFDELKAAALAIGVQAITAVYNK